MAKATTKPAAKKGATSKKLSAAVKTSNKAVDAPKIKAPKSISAAGTAKAKTVRTPKAKAPASSVVKMVKETSDAMSKLASDILSDRIVPTIEQIKSLAASALGQDQTKGAKSKRKSAKK